MNNVKAKLAEDLSADVVELWFDKEIVYSRVCSSCNSKVATNPLALGRFRRGLCHSCHQLAVVPDEQTAELRGTFTLEELGVPECHYISVVFSSGGEIRKAQLLVA